MVHFDWPGAAQAAQAPQSRFVLPVRYFEETPAAAVRRCRELRLRDECRPVLVEVVHQGHVHVFPHPWDAQAVG